MNQSEAAGAPPAAPPRPSRNREKVEALARVLASVDGYMQPDSMIYPGEPWRTRHGFVPVTEPQPAWTFYKRMAESALDVEWVADRHRERRA